MLDDKGYEKVMEAGENGFHRLEEGHYEESFALWGALTGAVAKYSTDFSYFNVFVTAPKQAGKGKRSATGPLAVKLTTGTLSESYSSTTTFLHISGVFSP